MLNHEIHPSPLHYAEADERHEKIIFKEKSYAIQGAIFEVYKKWVQVFWNQYIKSV